MSRFQFRTLRPAACIPALALLTSGLPAAAAAAESAAPGNIEEVVVVARTGSHIKRHADLPYPLTDYDGEDLRSHAAKDIRDLVGILPINNGAENNADNLTQNYTVGTANVNLRGLGVASTLVLLNGKRQVFSAVQTDDGASFVDLAALVPLLAVERVEILKDGASAIYGSDAVAGVANFITKRDYEGAEVQAEFRTRTNNGSQQDVNIDGVAGATFGEGGSFLIAASYLNRTSLVLGEVDWLRPATSGFGNPGSFNVPSLGRTVADPACSSSGGLLQELANGGTICRFDFGPQVTAVPAEDRVQGYAHAEWDFSARTQLWAELGYARNDISRDVSPSFPVLNTPVVPGYHPQNAFGEDVFFQGRPFGVGQPNEINYYQHNTVRLALGAEGRLADDLSWNVSFVRASTDAVLNPRDVIAANFQAALRGFGGNGCDTSPAATTPARPGEGTCLFFNPFASALSARPGEPSYNDPRLRPFIIGDYVGDAASELQVLEANLSGFWGDLAGGPVGFAVGAQLRDTAIATRYDSITQQDGFAFLIGNSNYRGETDVYATYAEVWLPFSERLEVSGALRFENYGGGVGSTLDPKVTAWFAASPTLSLRASAGTSFRAPSTFQTEGAQTNFVNILDFDGARTFAGRRTVGDPNLQPETATVFNVGGTWQPATNIEVDLDYWRYSFEDVLRKDNAQAIVNANPFDTRIERTSAGTIAIVNVAFINADAIDTSGIDFAARGDFETRMGLFSPYVEGTLIGAYDITNAGASIDGLGRLNRANLGAPNQRFKANIGTRLTRGKVAANAQLRFVGGYQDDGGMDIDPFATWDVNIAFGLGNKRHTGTSTTVRLGIINLTDEPPPFVNVAGSYDVRSADPRGRRAFIRLETRLGQ